MGQENWQGGKGKKNLVKKNLKNTDTHLKVVAIDKKMLCLGIKTIWNVLTDLIYEI